MAEFLLEVGCEELPAGWLETLSQELASRFRDAAQQASLKPQGQTSHRTPRRLVLVAQVQDRQPDEERIIWGPSVKIARNAAGNWTKAAEGFARKNGLHLDELQTAFKGSLGTEGGPTAQPLTEPSEEYVFGLKRISGRTALEVLPDLISKTLRGLVFPKRMAWDAWLNDGKGAFPFGRPIRWVVALYAGKLVPFEIYEIAGGQPGPLLVRSGEYTFGHRFLPRGEAGRRLKVSSFADLQDTLRANFVVLDATDRREQIKAALLPLGEGGLPPDDHGLVEDWSDLVEYPNVVVGSMPEEFASLPREILKTVLVHHQKYIPVPDAKGEIGRFAALTNGFASEADEQTIVRNMTRVVVARLRDAVFFWEEDSKRSLAERVGDLAGVTFHEDLGTYKDKTDRMVWLVERMGLKQGLLTGRDYEAAHEAARLSKADLTTAMVREFPELQGVMGGIYLTKQGYNEDVAKAVTYHYHPVSPAEHSTPAEAFAGSRTAAFAAVSMVDKLDTLAGYFGLGLVPRGSSDPYGLRRAAQGVVRVLLDFWPKDPPAARPKLGDQIAAAVRGHERTRKRPEDDVKRDLESFFMERIRHLLLLRGSLSRIAADEVDAVLGARDADGLADPLESWLRLVSLHKVRAEARDDFEHLAVAFKRARNILGDSRPGVVDPGLLTASAEQALHAAVVKLRTIDGPYDVRLRSLATLRGPVDDFFKDVMVMAEKREIRENRLALLHETLWLFLRIADISKLGGQA